MAEPPSMLVVDPPDHTRFRRLVSRAFTPRATAAFEPVVQRTADALLDALELRLGRPGGHVDLIDTYAAQLPVLVIADLLGVPSERREDFLRWGAAARPRSIRGCPCGATWLPNARCGRCTPSSASTSPGCAANPGRTW
ncbi:hypothetical protein [Blastococcus brunescens]|uniref:Cytochrome P450 n=1 Tax=Blastococcus brunescens TaxID=1564165 RepID=A0ABZ1B0F7_9ACTN|nr:hypothetical protein [Blastococcus sp. BMG 8361]WRL63241.1 hypothetical protein U6N30_26280 [Blastococcus sp. BMG 8361]